MRGTKTLGRAMWVIVATVALLFPATSCGGESTPTPTPAPVLRDVLTSAGENLAAMSSARFGMVDEKETGVKFFGTTFKSMEAEVKPPNSFWMLVDVVSPAFGFVQIEMMAVGEEAFIKLSEEAPWTPLPPDELPFNLGGVGVNLRDVLFTVRDGDGAITGIESVMGARTIRVEGTISSERMSDLITLVDPGHTVALTLWIDEADHLLRQMRLAGQLFDDDGPETTRLFTIDDIDVPVEIEIPDIGSGQ